MGFPIRKSPDHRLLASPRGLSQLTTSFIACLRQGIHTHALSSLTIKSISNTTQDVILLALCLLSGPPAPPKRNGMPVEEAALLVVNNARRIFNCQRSDFFVLPKTSKITLPVSWTESPSISSYGFVPALRNLVGLGRFELPTSPLSGVRSNHLSYRP